MILINTYETLEYDLSTLDSELASDLSPDERLITISFVNGKFQEVKYRFRAPYSKYKWEILALINKKVRELSKTSSA